MAEVKLKERLIEKLGSVEKESLLESMLLLLEMDAQESAIIDFNESDLSSIEAAKISARENGISNEKVFAKTKEWLNK
jgi:hypothetical protein